MFDSYRWFCSWGHFECASWFFNFHFGIYLYFPSLINESLHFQGFKSVLSCGSSHSWARSIFFLFFYHAPDHQWGRVPLVFLLGGVCSGPATEVTSEVRAPELFLSDFVCHSWLVAALVFGSLESFSLTASMTVFISWISALISFTSWAITLGFVVALCFLVDGIFFFLLPHIL